MAKRAAPPLPPSEPWRRYKIQRYVPVMARDLSDRPYLLADGWRTIAQADRLAVGERVLLQWHRDEPERAFRLVEEWPRGSELRIIREIRGMMTSYGAEVVTRGDKHWVPNALRFATQAEARAYVSVLAVGWTAVIETRVVPTADPVNYKWENGKLIKV